MVGPTGLRVNKSPAFHWPRKTPPRGECNHTVPYGTVVGIVPSASPFVSGLRERSRVATIILFLRDERVYLEAFP